MVRYLMRRDDAAPYNPANHTGTVNRRYVGPGALESSTMEVLRGTLQPSRGALPHSHPGIEQAVYMLSGRAEAQVGGERFELKAGDCCHFPANIPHSFIAIGETPAEIIVVYTPPYGERPENVIR